MRLDAEHRHEAIAAAEAHVLNARAGQPEFLSADYVTAEQKRSRYIEATKLRSGDDRLVREFEAYLATQPLRSGWDVRFLLHDERYTDGITIALVRIDAETATIEMEVFPRGGPAVA